MRWLKRLLILLAALSTAAIAAVFLAPGHVLDAELARKHWMAGVEERFIDVDGQRWRYLERGPADADVVVLLHGLQADSSTWLDVLRHAPDTRRYLIPDLPGFGGSPNPPGPDFRAGAQAERLHAWLDALHIGRVDLVGHSMGGDIAGRYTAAHPQRMRTLAFLDSAGVPFAPNDFMRAIQGGGNPYQLKTRADFDAFLDIVFKHRPFLPKPVLDAYADRALPRGADWNEAMRQLRQPEEVFVLAGLLPQLTMPSLVLWCREDRVLDVSSVDAFTAALPNEQVVLLDDCGHMPLMERPRETATAFAALWRSVYAAD